VPWVPIAGALVCLAQMVVLPLATWERLGIWLAVGLTIYFAYGRRRAAATRSLLAAEARAAEGAARAAAVRG
jgi:APA family basic amino acid/polyamine antiporter